MTSRRANGEGSIFPYRNGFAAYVWITTPSGKRQRKYVYGRTREIVHSRWIELTRKAARAGSSVNFEQSTLVPDHQLQRVRRSLLYREAKTEASDAWLPIPDIVTAALKIRRGRQDEEREAAGEIWQQTKDVPSLIFTGRYGTAIDPRTLNRKFVARCEAAGVRPITVHDARHTCATLLVDLDVHPRVIMRILRHADQAVTMEIYANASSAATREALRRLGDILE